MHSLLKESILLSMVHFLHGYHQSYWLPHFSWLKMIDPVTKVSGFASRHIGVRTFLMDQDLKKLIIAWSVDPHFAPFKNREAMRNEDEKTMLCEDLPSRFLLM